MDYVFFGFCATTTAAEPWLEAGYRVVIADIQHKPGIHWEGNLARVGIDLSSASECKSLLAELQGNCVFAGFFPPCTHLAISGSKWFRGKGLRSLQESVGYFATATELAEYLDCPYFIENPVSTISTYWRKWDYCCDPCDWNSLCPRDNYTKKTCLWVGNGFQMPEPQRDLELGPPDNRIHFAPDSKGRAERRSATPLGFSKAIFLANKPLDKPKNL